MPRGPARSTRPRVTSPTRWQRRAGCTASTHSLPVAVSKPGESATTPFGDTVRSAFSPRNGAVRRAREAVEKTIAPRPWKTLRGPHFTANKTADIIPRIYHSRSGFKLGQRYVLTCREIMKLPGETGIMAGAGGGPCWGLLGAVLAIPLLVGPIRAQQTSAQASGKLPVKAVRQGQRTAHGRGVTRLLRGFARSGDESGRRSRATDSRRALKTASSDTSPCSEAG